MPLDAVGWRMTSTPIRVLVADDHAIVRTGIRHVLESEPGFAVVGEASNGTEALALAARAPARCRRARHLDARRRPVCRSRPSSRHRRPDTRMLILSMHDNTEYVLESLRAGAHGYLLKDTAGHRAARRDPRGMPGRVVLQSAGRPPARRGGPGRAGRPPCRRWTSSPPGSGRC